MLPKGIFYATCCLHRMKDGKVVESGNRYKLLNFNNEIYSLLVQNVEMGDTGRYTCWAHNKYGEAMTEAYLNVIGG